MLVGEAAHIPPNPGGLCMCGCGGETGIVRDWDDTRGYQPGDRRRYVKGHHPKPQRRGPEHPLWRGGRVRNSDGYIVRTIQDNHPLAAMAYIDSRTGSLKVLEHRLVMGEYLRRPLTAWEEVHHVNSVRDDNRIENLQLRVKPHGRGALYVCLDCGSSRVAPTRLPDEGGDANGKDVQHRA